MKSVQELKFKKRRNRNKVIQSSDRVILLSEETTTTQYIFVIKPSCTEVTFNYTLQSLFKKAIANTM